MADQRKSYDIAIVGGGFAGLSAALALQTQSNGQLKLVLIDPTIGSAKPQDLRSSAIAASAKRMLEKLGAWPDDMLSQPILSMRITDSKLEDGARQSLLSFAGTDFKPSPSPKLRAFDTQIDSQDQFVGDAAASHPFAHMIENRHLTATLQAAFDTHKICSIKASVESTAIEGRFRKLQLSTGEQINASLVIACDGARSKLRDAVKLQMVGRDYDQAAIVTTISHERPHGGEAIEHFLEAGPFAALPLPDDEQGRHRSSIVWTERKPDAEQLLKLEHNALENALTERLGHAWGKVSIIDKVQSFPLSIKIARRFVADRLALVGDAAHVIHPIAGQGLNMGFRDVAALSEVIVNTLRLGLDIGNINTLEQYQSWRRFDTLMMGMATDGLNALFSRESLSLRGLRGMGMQLVDRISPLKNFFISSAAGTLGDTPRLMR